MVPLSRSCDPFAVAKCDLDFPSMALGFRIVVILVLAITFISIHKEDCLDSLKFHLSARLVKRVFRTKEAEVIVRGRKIRDVPFSRRPSRQATTTLFGLSSCTEPSYVKLPERRPVIHVPNHRASHVLTLMPVP
jgi:hypothetical protein